MRCTNMLRNTLPSRCAAILGLLGAQLLAVQGRAQERLDEIPGYDRYLAVQEAVRKASDLPAVRDLAWSDEGQQLSFRRGDASLVCDLATGRITAAATALESAEKPYPVRRRAARGRQVDEESSPDGLWTAVCRANNVVLVDSKTGEEHQVTTDGTRSHRYGTASWVYGEELDQTSAMWWSPDSKRLAFYEFDESNVMDMPLPVSWSSLRPSITYEAYPKPGEPNPIARILIREIPTGEITRVDTGIDTDAYVYNVRFSPDGRWLLFNRTNRRQDHLELLAADPATGTTRVVLEESQPTWQDNNPTIQFLNDHNRFIWQTERNGFINYDLCSLDQGRMHALTSNTFPGAGIVKVDEAQGLLWYAAFSDSNPLSQQLHVVKLDGSSNRRVTMGSEHHSQFTISPDGCTAVCRIEALATPPRTVAIETRSGREIATLSQADAAPIQALHVPEPELFHFTTDDGLVTLYGTLHRPSSFDRKRKYPLLVEVYGGPLSQSVHNIYAPARPSCEFGFLVAEIDNRGTKGRGKRFEDATYLKLGQVDLDDQVAAIRYLSKRPEVDGSRVGIAGHSYGGYMSALAILKYPEVFRAAVAGAPVTDWRQYDTIYTERFMRTPTENSGGYDAASCLTYLDRYRGGLLILHGLVDDNVHPTNTFSLIEPLQKADKPFDLMVFPAFDHGIGSPMYRSKRMTFLYRKLVKGE